MADPTWGVPTDSYDPSDGSGQREGQRPDVLDVIINIDPVETPFFSSIKKRPAYHTKHEWLQDSLTAPNSSNAAVEGEDPTFSPASDRVRDYNYTQIVTQPVAVTGTQRAIRNYGMSDEMAYQMTNAMHEHARDIEAILLRSASRGAGTGFGGAGTGTARTLAGISGDADFIDGYTAGTGNTTDKAGAGTFSEDEFNDSIQDAWDDGGNVDLVMTSGKLKRALSKMTGNNLTRNIAASDKRLIAAIDVYESDFGLVRIMANRWVTYSTSGDIYFLELARWRAAILRPTKVIPIAKTGDSDKRLILTELTLEGLAPKANACIKATTGYA